MAVTPMSSVLGIALHRLTATPSLFRRETRWAPSCLRDNNPRLAPSRADGRLYYRVNSYAQTLTADARFRDSMLPWPAIAKGFALIDASVS